MDSGGSTFRLDISSAHQWYPQPDMKKIYYNKINTRPIKKFRFIEWINGGVLVFSRRALKFTFSREDGLFLLKTILPCRGCLWFSKHLSKYLLKSPRTKSFSWYPLIFMDISCIRVLGFFKIHWFHGFRLWNLLNRDLWPKAREQKVL